MRITEVLCILNNIKLTYNLANIVVDKIDILRNINSFVTVADVFTILLIPYEESDKFIGWDNTDHMYVYRSTLEPYLYNINWSGLKSLKSSMLNNSFNMPYASGILASEYDGDPVETSTIKMSIDRFKELLDELDDNSLQTLKEKNARYSTDGDCLHNFRSGAEIVGGTPAQTCWGYMTKHLVALRDMVMKDDFSNREDFLEKCQDTINYIRFLWCIGNDESTKKKRRVNGHE